MADEADEELEGNGGLSGPEEVRRRFLKGEMAPDAWFESNQYRVELTLLGGCVAMQVEDTDREASNSPMPGPAYAELTPEAAREIAMALIIIAADAEAAAEEAD